MRPTAVRHPVIAYRRARLMPRWVRRIDRAAGRRINAARSWGAPDRAYRRLSRSADRGALWYAVAATLLLLGRRRAAVRGVVSMVIAGVLSDVVVKRFFDGRRPLFREVPTARRLRVYPATPSFPSGHSASAAGFATGVALESSAAGAAIAPLAVAVAYSRLHVGAHWLSDVVGGVTLGAAVALLGRLLVPARRSDRAADPASVAEIVEPLALPALADGAGLLIVLNKAAGGAVLRADPRPVIAERLPRATVRELDPDETMDAAVRAAMSAARPPIALGAYGGDGSLASMARLALEFDLPFLALPGGTFNHFARAVGVDSVDRAIDALNAGTGVAASVGELVAGERATTVLNAASVGIYPGFVAERARRRPRLGKWIGGVAATWRQLRSADPIDVALDGRRARVWSVFVSVGRNTPGQVATMQRRTISDEVLDARVLHARGSRVQAVAALSFGAGTRAALRALRLLPPASDIESIVTTAVAVSVQPRSGDDTFYAHDGELERRPAVGPDGRYTLTCRIVPRALRVYAPR